MGIERAEQKPKPKPKNPKKKKLHLRDGQTRQKTTLQLLMREERCVKQRAAFTFLYNIWGFPLFIDFRAEMILFCPTNDIVVDDF